MTTDQAESLNILVLGGGGREHALCWKIAQSPMMGRLWCAPGNAAMAAPIECVDLAASDPAAVVSFAIDNEVDLVVIGPEAPLAAGVSDALRAADILTFGPSQAAAMLEISKTFTKTVADACGAPTARYMSFDDLSEAETYIQSQGAPIVVKDDGLAAGKGVTVAQTVDEALAAVRAALTKDGARVVVEDCLTGPEISFFVLTDGVSVLPLAGAQDHKRAYDGDKGPNTGGMGAYSPAPILTPDLSRRILDEIVKPVLCEMTARGTPYSGVLYAGVMLTIDGPKLIEFNARFGDPECQVILTRLKSDLVPALLATAQGDLADMDLIWSSEAAMTVTLAANGYPASPMTNTPVGALNAAQAVDGAVMFGAALAADPDAPDAYRATGGRVLYATALGGDLRQAQRRAYRAAAAVDFPDGFYRRDIGWRALDATALDAAQVRAQTDEGAQL